MIYPLISFGSVLTLALNRTRAHTIYKNKQLNNFCFVSHATTRHIGTILKAAEHNHLFVNVLHFFKLRCDDHQGIRIQNKNKKTLQKPNTHINDQRGHSHSLNFIFSTRTSKKKNRRVIKYHDFKDLFRFSALFGRESAARTIPERLNIK